MACPFVILKIISDPHNVHHTVMSVNNTVMSVNSLSSMLNRTEHIFIDINSGHCFMCAIHCEAR